MISRSELRSLFSYDKETQVWRYLRSTRNGIAEGNIAGTRPKRGRSRIKINGVLYYADDLAKIYEGEQ